MQEVSSMESSTSSATPSLFLLSNELELNELLCDLSSPHSSSPCSFFSNTALSALQDHGYHNDIDIDWEYPTPSTPLNSNSTHWASSLTTATTDQVAKRDWLSSLSQTSWTPAARVSSSPSLHELIGGTSSSSSPLSSVDPSANRKLRHSLSANNLQTCGWRSGPQHRSIEEKCMGTKVADHAGVVLSPSNHVPANGCTDGATKSSSIALRLSDIIAALQPKPPIVSHEVSTSPTFTPASKATPNFNTPVEILANVDKILQETRKDATPAIILTHRGSKKSKKSSKSEKKCDNKGHDDIDALKCLVQSRQKRRQEQGPVADPAMKREVHIFSERERRRGMTHLYGTLRSLLPQGKVKKVQPDRCSVLTETMKYIETLLEQLEELGRQKTEALASVGGKGDVEPSSVDAMDAETGCSDPKANVNTHIDPNLATGNDGTNMKLKSAIAAALCRYYSLVEANSQDGRACMSEHHDDDVVDDDGIVAELDNVNDMDVFEGEGRCVGVRFFGEDAFITVRTMRKKGVWSGLLELLQNLGINVFNVTLAAANLDSDHHCIHAKIPSGCKLSSSELRRCLKTFVNTMTSESSPATWGDLTMDD